MLKLHGVLALLDILLVIEGRQLIPELDISVACLCPVKLDWRLLNALDRVASQSHVVSRNKNLVLVTIIGVVKDAIGPNDTLRGVIIAIKQGDARFERRVEDPTNDKGSFSLATLENSLNREIRFEK